MADKNNLHSSSRGQVASSLAEVANGVAECSSFLICWKSHCHACVYVCSGDLREREFCWMALLA